LGGAKLLRNIFIAPPKRHIKPERYAPLVKEKYKIID
jgi:hypothetical protein